MIYIKINYVLKTSELQDLESFGEFISAFPILFYIQDVSCISILANPYYF